MRGAMAWAAPVACMAVVSVALSLSIPLFALLLERLGASGTVIGLNHTASALAMVVTAPLLPAILLRVGLIPLMLGSVITLVVCTLLIPVWQSVWWWSLLRIGFGFAATALFFSSEYWVVSKAPDEARGRIVGGYVIVLSGSYMVGPILLNFLGIDSWLTFAVPAAVILSAAIPLVLGRHHAPPPSREETTSPLATLVHFRTDPLIIWGVVLFGVIEFGAMGLIAVWGLRTGYEQETAVTLVFWLAFGALVMQLPVGWAADRFDRRRLLAVGALLSIAGPACILIWPTVIEIVALSVVVWGGMAVAFYSLALTELGARYSGQAMARANAAVVLAYSLGALISPGAFGLAMDAIPPDGILWLAMAAAGAYLLLAIVRIRQTRGP